MRCCGSGCHNGVEQHQSLRHARWVALNRSSHRRFAPSPRMYHNFVCLKCIFSLWKWNSTKKKSGAKKVGGVETTWCKFQELKM
jgi:hypothetical protein